MGKYVASPKLILQSLIGHTIIHLIQWKYSFIVLINKFGSNDMQNTYKYALIKRNPNFVFFSTFVILALTGTSGIQ